MATISAGATQSEVAHADDTEPASAALQALADETSSSGFDPNAPFDSTGDIVVQDGPVEMPEGTELTAEEIAAVHAGGTPPGPNMAFATAGPTIIDWRGDGQSEEEDIDVELAADASVPTELVDAFYEAVREYRDLIDLDLDDPYTHHIELGWEPISGNVLAYASTSFIGVSQGGQTFRVPLLLADSLSKTNNGGSAPAMRLVFNSNINWDYGSGVEIEDPTGYHLKTLLLHELGHGLGLSSGIGLPSEIATVAQSAWTQSVYSAQNTSRPLSAGLQSDLLQNDLWFRNTDGTWEKIFDPSSWQQGSSLSHLDEASYPSGVYNTYKSGSLMTPYAGQGEASPVDGVVVGLLGRVGYRTFMSPSAPTAAVSYDNATVTVQVEPTEGGAVHIPARTWTIEVRQYGDLVATSGAVSATLREVSVNVSLQEGEYSVAVIAGAYDQSESVSATLVVTPGQQSTEDQNTPEYYADCTAVRAVGLAPMRDSHESFRSVFDTDGDGFGCEQALVVQPYEPQLDPAAPQTWYRFQIARLYSAYFGRYPDEAGWQFWNNQFVGGKGLGDMSQYFSASPEFRMTYGDALSNAEFVNLVYTNVLGRPGEPEGMAFWEGRLSAGMSRGNMMIGFSESLEFVFNAGATATGTCWQADSPFDFAGVRLSYECAAGETAGVS